MRLAAIVLTLSALLAGPSFADEPLLRPSRDVDVTYRAVAPQGGNPIEQRVRWLATQQTMRIDPPAPGLHVIIDYVARRMSVVRDATKSVIDMAAPDGVADAIGGKTATGYVPRRSPAAHVPNGKPRTAETVRPWSVSPTMACCCVWARRMGCA
jgi:hypothetical protein